MIYLIIAAAILFGLAAGVTWFGWWVWREAKRDAELQEARNANEIEATDLEIAARPDLEPDAILDRMRKPD